MAPSYEDLDPNGLLLNIYSRTTCRDFSREHVDDEKIQLVLEAARFAPSSGNIQNWEFILVKDDNSKENVAEACSEQFWLSEANILIVIVTDEEMARRFYYEDGPHYSAQGAAMAAENMLIAAKSQGLGSAFVSSFDDEALRALLSIPKYVRIQGIVAVGKEKYTPKISDRKELYDICYVKKYGNRISNMDVVLYDLNILGRLRESLQDATPKIKNAIEETTVRARFEMLQKHLALKDRQIKSLKEELEKMQLAGPKTIERQPDINVHNTFFEGPWSYHVLKQSKGIDFPAGKEELLEKLSGITVNGKKIESIIERIELPVESHSYLLKKIKEAASNSNSSNNNNNNT